MDLQSSRSRPRRVLGGVWDGAEKQVWAFLGREEGNSRAVCSLGVDPSKAYWPGWASVGVGGQCGGEVGEGGGDRCRHGRSGAEAHSGSR